MSGGPRPPLSSASPTAVVTGVSSGIGAAVVRVLIERGYRVFGSVRSKADRKQAVLDFGAGFVPLLFDVTDEKAIAAAAGLVAEALNGRRLDVLVNNAGIVVSGPSLELPLAEFRQQLEVNLLGQVAVTRQLAPLLARPAGPGRQRSARIVNLSSVAGRTAWPFLAPYAASKHALEAWSDSLRRELLLAGLAIDVTVIAPGPIRTAIWEKGAATDRSRYAATPYAAALDRLASYAVRQGETGEAPERVARTVLKAITAKRPKPRYLVTRQPLTSRLLPCLPKRLLDRMVLRRFGAGG
jgi:NAD(P)-dependent dehydrogenase (short-subunit alcohol dehydrogenase family)